MKKLLVVAVILLSGCATRYTEFNDSEYVYYASTIATSELCFDAGFVSTDLMSQTQSNMKTVLSIRNYDRERFLNHYVKTKAELAPTVNAENCRHTELRMKDVIALGKKIDRNHAIQASKPEPQYFTNTGGNRMFCNTIGSMTFCN